MRAVYLNPISEVINDKAQVNHLSNVLRLRSGESLVVFDGSGAYYKALVKSVERKQINLELGVQHDYEPQHNIELALGWIKKDAFEVVLNTAVQVGVSKIHLFNCDYSQKPLNLSKERFRKILISSAEQSNHFVLPELIVHESIGDLHVYDKWDRQICFTLGSGSGSGFGCKTEPEPESILKSADRKVHLEKSLEKSTVVNKLKFLYWIGPEGGFSHDEERYFLNKCMNFFQIPVPIMRAQVAVSCALGYILGKHS